MSDYRVEDMRQIRFNGSKCTTGKILKLEKDEYIFHENARVDGWHKTHESFLKKYFEELAREEYEEEDLFELGFGG